MRLLNRDEKFKNLIGRKVIVHTKDRDDWKPYYKYTISRNPGKADILILGMSLTREEPPDQHVVSIESPAHSLFAFNDTFKWTIQDDPMFEKYKQRLLQEWEN
jgi:hypothetical protein